MARADPAKNQTGRIGAFLERTHETKKQKGRKLGPAIGPALPASGIIFDANETDAGGHDGAGQSAQGRGYARDAQESLRHDAQNKVEAQVNIAKESVPEVKNGHQVVGTSRVRLSGQTALKGVLLRCPGPSDPVPNIAPVWIGGAGVTADSGAAGGTPILPSDAMFIPIDRLDSLYCISTAANQDISWFAC